MNLKNFLEEFKNSFKAFGKTIEVFRNPSQKEFDEVAKNIGGKFYVRFIATGKLKELLIFSPETLHYTVLSSLGIDKSKTYNIENPTNLWAVAEKNRGKWKIHSSDQSFNPKESRKKKSDFKWLEKYMDIEEYFNTEEPDFNKNRKVFPGKFES